jgi:AmmeMemoRadiSam system protein B
MGWYPRDPEEINEFLSPFRNKTTKDPQSPLDPAGIAAIAPHAGWYYSGRIAARSVSSLDKDAETVVVIGGHNPGGGPFLFADEEGARTPLGVMIIDGELRDLLKKKLGGRSDRYQDNTVEVLLPMVHSLFPKAKLLWLRFPGDLSSFEAGKTLGEAAKEAKRRIVVLGSTDLTHYGDNYGFSPKGKGQAALNWMRDTNDAAFVRAVLEGDPKEVLRRADEDSSACSVGAVMGALGFAEYVGVKKGELLEYGTSADVSDDGKVPGSFVGYVSILWRR